MLPGMRYSSTRSSNTQSVVSRGRPFVSQPAGRVLYSSIRRTIRDAGVSLRHDCCPTECISPVLYFCQANISHARFGVHLNILFCGLRLHVVVFTCMIRSSLEYSGNHLNVAMFPCMLWSSLG